MGDVIAMTTQRARAEEKRLLNNKNADVNQLLPIKYAWAWRYYLNGCANHWMPEEVSMQRDIEQWKRPGGFTDDERLVVKRALGFFSTAETVVANNLLMAIYTYVTAPECRMYILRQAFEEAIHTHSYGVYMPEALGMDTGELMNMYREIPSIHDKEEFGARLTSDIMQPNFETDSFEGRQRLLRNLLGYYVITEGIFFYTTFVMLLSFGRQNRLPGVCEQVQYILRDESMHLNFGIDLVHAIIKEEPALWTPALQQWVVDNVRQGVILEYRHAEDSLPNGLLGLTHGMMREYVQHIADRRLEKLGLPKPYGSANPFPWMSEVIDLGKEKNFFETRVTEYQTGGTLNWD